MLFFFGTGREVSSQEVIVSKYRVAVSPNMQGEGFKVNIRTPEIISNLCIVPREGIIIDPYKVKDLGSLSIMVEGWD